MKIYCSRESRLSPLYQFVGTGLWVRACYAEDYQNYKYFGTPIYQFIYLRILSIDDSVEGDRITYNGVDEKYLYRANPEFVMSLVGERVYTDNIASFYVGEPFGVEAYTTEEMLEGAVTK